MKKLIAVLALASVLALSFALTGCSSSDEPEQADDAAAIAEDAQQATDDAQEAADDVAQATDDVQELVPSFDIEQFVKDNDLGEFERYYPVEDESGEIFWGVVTKNAEGEEAVTYLDDSGNFAGVMEVGSMPDAE